MTKLIYRIITCILCLCGCCSLLGSSAYSAPSLLDPSLPHLVQKDGRYSLFVDNAPYLMLGVQINNSSAWPGELPKVWPAVEYVHANSVEMPVYWEQLEPTQGNFDYSVVDTLLAQARQHHVHLVLLWFGTWKNGSSHYEPVWIKADPIKYPRMLGASGDTVDSPSPFSTDALREDITAFKALMAHLKLYDTQHTVLLVQVENETGTWGSVRDYSPAAQKRFDEPVPSAMLKAIQPMATASAHPDWADAYGTEAEIYFHGWYVASYVGKVAAAGKAIYPLPLYVNAALRDPIAPGPPGSYESGGPTDDLIPIWKAAAPAIDILAPDIYMSDYAKYTKVLDLYGRSDNALLVPETTSSPGNARFFFDALGHQSIGYSPFGVDFTSTQREPYTPDSIAKWLDPLALTYGVIGPMDRQIAQLNFDDHLQAVAEDPAAPAQSLNFGKWIAKVTFGAQTFGFGNNPAPGNSEPIGRALVGQLGPDQFLVTGFYGRVDFKPVDPAKNRQFVKVEEGSYKDGVFVPIRIWNGDQTDRGLNFFGTPVVLRVTVGTY